MQAARISGNNIYFRTEGSSSGPALVFVNSLGTDWRVWASVAAHFSSSCRLLFHDKRGHGLSDVPDGPLRIDDHVQDLAELLDELAVRDAVVCGVSVGGMIALGLGAERADLVRALVLCDTGHRIGTQELWNQRIEAVRSGGMEAVADMALERWLSETFRRTRPAETGLWRNMLLRTPAAGYIATCAALRDADLTAAARSLSMPALCLCGSEDQATPPALTRELHTLIPDSRYHDLPGAHLPTVESPAEVAGRVRSFLEELSIV